eukprot:126258-Prorocentrum_lima.AAC.1
MAPCKSNLSAMRLMDASTIFQWPLASLTALRPDIGQLLNMVSSYRSTDACAAVPSCSKSTVQS